MSLAGQGPEVIAEPGLRQTLIRAAGAGGSVLLKYFGRVAPDWKADGTVVTEADSASERRIIEEIEKDFPDCSLLAEESGFQRRSSPITIVIDPLDGTSNFVCGLPWFGVLIAALSGAETIAAAMYLPTLDIIYECEKGSGLFRNGRKVVLSESTGSEDRLYTICFDPCASKSPERENLLRLVSQMPAVRTTASLFDYSYFLEGLTAGFVFAAGSSRIWDVAGLPLIIREAGGVVTDLDGKELDLQPGEAAIGREYPVIASSSLFHKQMLRAILESE